MNNIFYILFFINFIRISNSLYLNKYQIQKINNLIQNPSLSIIGRQKINYILYKSFEKFAIKKALLFKNLHKYKCVNIPNEELFFSSKIGLFKSIQKYNGKYNLINYSNIYINSELYKLVTDKYSLSLLPKKYRIKNKNMFNMSEIYKYKYLLNTKFSNQYDSWYLDSKLVSNEDILNNIIEKDEIKEKFNHLFNSQTAFVKRIIYLKYIFNSTKILSNKHISKLMCCSEETIRKHIINLKHKCKDIFKII